MKRFHLQTLCTLFVVLVSSCSSHSISNKLASIKHAGDENPTAALAELDSLEGQIGTLSKYEKYKMDLLRIRLRDKADIMPNSDDSIKYLIEYFQDNGSLADKQEAFYYAGSVYRDLDDTPRALEFFLKSLEYTNSNDCDSVIIQHTFSNLAYLYYKIQDYNEALEYSRKELKICVATNSDLLVARMHLGAAFIAVDSGVQAKKVFNEILEDVTQTECIEKHQETLIYLLNYYSGLNDKERANVCYHAINRKTAMHSSSFTTLAFAEYFRLIGETDSAIIYCKRIITDNKDLFDMHDAARMLYQIYTPQKDFKHAYQYAKAYIELSDSLDLGKRQELAATVNNEFKYYHNLQKEQELKNQNRRYKQYTIVAFILTVLVICLSLIFYYRKKARHLERINSLSSDLERLSMNESQLLEEISAKEKLIEQKMAQNKEFIKQLHQLELEDTAEDVINAIKDSAAGKKNMNTNDWRQLYQAVDKLYPTFKDILLKELGEVTEQQQQLCYLLLIGMKKTHIQNITGLSRATIWRWEKKYDWIFIPAEDA